MKGKRQAVASGVLTLVCTLALGVIGFFLVGSYEAQTPNAVLGYLYKFLFLFTPFTAISTLIAIARIKADQ